MRYITFEYKCSCGAAWRELPVRERGEQEDIADWMDDVARAAGLDHVKVSPWCQSVTFNLRIPMAAEGSSVGRMVRQ